MTKLLISQRETEAHREKRKDGGRAPGFVPPGRWRLGRAQNKELRVLCRALVRVAGILGRQPLLLPPSVPIGRHFLHWTPSNRIHSKITAKKASVAPSVGCFPFSPQVIFWRPAGCPVPWLSLLWRQRPAFAPAPSPSGLPSLGGYPKCRSPPVPPTARCPLGFDHLLRRLAGPESALDLLLFIYHSEHHLGPAGWKRHSEQGLTGLTGRPGPLGVIFPPELSFGSSRPAGSFPTWQDDLGIDFVTTSGSGPCPIPKVGWTVGRGGGRE